MTSLSEHTIEEIFDACWKRWCDFVQPSARFVREVYTHTDKYYLAFEYRLHTHGVDEYYAFCVTMGEMYRQWCNS